MTRDELNVKYCIDSRFEMTNKESKDIKNFKKNFKKQYHVNLEYKNGGKGDYKIFMSQPAAESYYNKILGKIKDKSIIGSLEIQEVNPDKTRKTLKKFG